MKQLTLNGVVISIATQTDLEQAGINPHDWIRLDDADAVFLHPLSRRDALIAAGFDLSRADFALPQAWVDKNCRGREAFQPEDWLWDYLKASVFGEPLYVGSWKLRIRRQVFEHLVAS